jgi:small multidrug resistance pump
MVLFTWEAGLILLGIVLAEAFAQSSVKRYHTNRYYLDFILAVLGYTVVCYFLTKAYSFNQMGTVNAMWSALSVISISIVGYMLFKETYSRNEIIGMLLIVSGLVFINLDL